MASSWPSSTSRPADRTSLTAIVERAQALTGGSGAALALATEHPEEIECYVRSGRTAPPLGRSPLQEGSLTARCLRSGQRLLCDNAQTDPRTASTAVVELGIRSLALTPIRRGDDVVGVLTVFADVADAFSAEHLAHLETAARELSMVLEAPGAVAQPAGHVPPEAAAESNRPGHDGLAVFPAPAAGQPSISAGRLILTNAAFLLLIGLGAWSYWVLFARPARLAARRSAEVAAERTADSGGPTRAPATLTVEPGVVVAKRTESFTVTITASRASEATSVAAQITYDGGLLQLVSLAGGGILADGGQAVLAHRDDPQAGVVRISAQRLAGGPPGDSAILSLVFHPRTTGTGKILVAVGARDSQGHAIEVPEGHAEVTIE